MKFALFVNLGACEDPWREVQELLGLYEQEMLKNGDAIAPALSFADIERNRSEVRISAILTVEEGGVCGGDLEKLRMLYGQGVRIMTLSWNYPNELGSPNLDARHIVTASGIECLGLGSDFDGIDTHAELTEADRMLWVYRELLCR